MARSLDTWGSAVSPRDGTDRPSAGPGGARQRHAHRQGAVREVLAPEVVLSVPPSSPWAPGRPWRSVRHVALVGGVALGLGVAGCGRGAPRGRRGARMSTREMVQQMMAGV